jgi:adenylate cyclase class IV
MREVELKAVVDDLAERGRESRRRARRFRSRGRFSDRRYDFASREPSGRDEVLRVRRYHGATSTKTYLDWKGATEFRDVYKVREEITTPVEDYRSLELILFRLELELVWEIDRDIAQYQIGGATIRFEVYPRMDVLVEVEGDGGDRERDRGYGIGAGDVLESKAGGVRGGLRASNWGPGRGQRERTERRL